ncbi:MAG: ABC transporter ATP-binding protein, partial [Rhizobacter sp.]|nr:ABC transporter ATP-binding protein [Rhizobacter sp.]
MTPDLMKAGAQTRIARESKTTAVRSGGGEAAFMRRHEPGSLDLTHGQILYLEDITVSFDGFKA